MNTVYHSLQWLGFLCLALFFCHCGGDFTGTETGYPLPLFSRELARVGGEVIKEDEFRFRLLLELDKFPKSFFKKQRTDIRQDQSVLQSVLDRVFTKLIDDQIILSYGKKIGIQMSAEELESAFEKKKLALGPKEMDSLLSEKKIPFRRFRQIVEAELQVQYVLDQALGPKIRVNLNEVQQYYATHRQEFAVPEQVRVRHMVTDSLAKAEEIHKRLVAGENFAKLAVNHSLSPDRAKGGDLGFFARGTFPKEFDESCFRLEKGQISPIVKSDYGYHVFKLLDRKPAGIKELKDVTAIIHQRLFEDRLAKHYQEWMTLARRAIPVKVHADNLKDFVL